MPILPLFGHTTLAGRLERAAREHRLPASLLLHGPAGVGKQRLALRLAQTLLCTAPEAPCGQCQSCRFALELTHPDLHWYFPRPRLRDADPSADEVEADYAEARAERARAHGLYPAPSGSEGLYVATVRAMLQQAARSPALGRRKLFVVGDAERMVPQEGSEQAANAFLKLLEEPPADTTLILTSSEPGALLPTIRSRVVALRVAPLPATEVREFLRHEAVRIRLPDAPGAEEARLRLAAGCPGRLLESAEQGGGLEVARRLMEAAESGSRARWLRAAAGLGAGRARGGFASALEALTVLLHQQVRAAVERGDEARAVRLGGTLGAVEEAKARARGNVNPQLAGSVLLRELARAVQ
ncbi:MAG TPA: AAA family ATPase [Gemmatimonadaceae bacterium]|nr:AAA family ATPase [Gemmatimonadaceae bacterium]